MPPSVIGKLLAINGPACMTSAPQTEHSFGDGARRSPQPRLERASERAPFSIMGVHNADSAESSLHTLLAYPTALLSSLISPVNASPRLIENELAPCGCWKGGVGGGGAYVPEPRTQTPLPTLQERRQKTSYCMRRIAYTGK